ncbi:hypothetical protein L1049_028578 [Liquidambar formosana]|uniref:F-box domain-containing protein n=1 Tax=Liquidambar formosana TaxID=63359 RepID=A0AAP0WWD7_LIQFO
MAKRVKQTSICAQEQLGDGRHNDSEDQISELPDEILACIVSRLTFREVASTSVLSKRWRDVWTFSTGSLDLDGMKKKWEDPWLLKVEQSRYINWVNRVLELHQGSTIDEFRIHFWLDNRFKSSIDKWVDFAIAKRAQRLELNLEIYGQRTENMQFPQYELSKLRHLTLTVYASDSESLLGFTRLIKASPLLHSFTLQLDWIGPRRRKKLQRAPKCTHQYLKVVEFVGFVGRPIDLELAMYVLENAVMLEKIIVNPNRSSFFFMENSREVVDSEEKLAAARECAKQLKTLLPHGVELVIL